VLLLAFLLGQALGLPEVENPIPEKIGLADVFTVAGIVKSFVRDREDDRWVFILVGVLATMIVLLANAVSELVYLPLLLLFLLQQVRSYSRQRAERRAKALPAAARSRGSR
jgi:Ca2+/Na+ antiporter